MPNVLYTVNYNEIKNCQICFFLKSAWFLHGIHKYILMKLISIQLMKIDKKVSEKTLFRKKDTFLFLFFVVDFFLAIWNFESIILGISS